MSDEEVLGAIGKRLVALRKKAGYTSYETFAFDHGMARQQYWRMEQGANITIKTLLKVLEIHKMSIEDFFKLDAKGE
jgi:transcriptional regulator with XRE-family HTH domain